MKVAFYIDPNISALSTFYTKFLLIDELEKLGHQVTMHIPNHPSEDAEDPYYPFINKFQNRLYNYPIAWSQPKEPIYDALILTHQRNGKWKTSQKPDKKTVYDTRRKLALQFLKAQKPVLAIKDELSMEFIPITEGVKYGNYTNFRLNLLPSICLPENANQFVMPAFSNMIYPRPKALTKAEFYENYSLDPELKIICFFLPKYIKYQTLKKKKSPLIRGLQFVLTNFSKFNTILNELGYQLIFKSHRGDSNSFLVETKLPVSDFKILYPIHTYEAVKYSSFALTCLSNVVYELFLQRLPVLEIGPGLYYPGWWFKKYEPTKFPVGKYKPKDLIFGAVIPQDKLIKSPKATLERYLTTKYDLGKQVRCRKNHPLYGTSYVSNMPQIAKIISQQLKS